MNLKRLRKHNTSLGRSGTCLKDKSELHHTHEVHKTIFIQLFLTAFVASISEQHVSVLYIN